MVLVERKLLERISIGALIMCALSTKQNLTFNTSELFFSVQIYCGSKTFTDVANVDLPQSLKQDFMEAAVINSMAKTNLVSGPKMGDPVYTGNDTECGLLVMANVMGTRGAKIDYDSETMPYKEIRQKFPDDQVCVCSRAQHACVCGEIDHDSEKMPHQEIKETDFDHVFVYDIRFLSLRTLFDT